MHLRTRLLDQLADGEFHSGESLGMALGVSRMAVWKHIRSLRDSGVAMDVVRGRGYRLQRPLELLDADAIMCGLTAHSRRRIGPLVVLQETASTNSWLCERAVQGAPAGSVCLAEYQHAGRGRRGRRWLSPYAANLYLSLLWRSASGAAAIGGLSLAVGVAVLRCLRAAGAAAAGLKWPNDILVDNAKLAGILLDVVGESTGPCAVVIGVGVNVSMPAAGAGQIDQHWTDLTRVTGAAGVSRNLLAAALLDHLLDVMHEFEHSGVQGLLSEWRRHDLLADREIALTVAGRTVHGRAGGVDSNGALLVYTVEGMRRFASGEVSVRAVP